MATAKVESKDNIDQVFVVGFNGSGQFGLMHANNISELTEWTQNISIKRINCGRAFTIITDHNNDFWCAGLNGNGQLGLCHSNKTVQQFIQNQYFRKNNINIKSIMTNAVSPRSSTFFLSQTNKLYECGGHSSNQPVLIDNVTNIKDAQSCDYFTILLDNNGIACSRLQAGGDGYNFSNTNSTGFHPIPFFHNKRVTQISVGGQHALFMDSGANIWCCGWNGYGQLGLGHYTHSQNPQLIEYFADNTITITKMCSGYLHNLCVDETGIVYAFGRNHFGQCGLPKGINQTHTPIKMYTLSKHKIIDIKCSPHHSYCKSDADKHWLFGYNGNNQCTLTASRSGGRIFEPFCINETVLSITNGKQIKEVYVGHCNTWIITGVITAENTATYSVFDDAKVEEAVSKAFIKNDGKTEKINELEAKNQDLDAKNQDLDADNQEKDREIALLTEKVAAQNRKTDKKCTIEEWLTDIVGLPQYIDNFVDAALEMDILAEVTNDNLKEIEIKKLGHRVKIMKAIKDMRDATGTK